MTIIYRTLLLGLVVTTGLGFMFGIIEVTEPLFGMYSKWIHGLIGIPTFKYFVLDIMLVATPLILFVFAPIVMVLHKQSFPEDYK